MLITDVRRKCALFEQGGSFEIAEFCHGTQCQECWAGWLMSSQHKIPMHTTILIAMTEFELFPRACIDITMSGCERVILLEGL